MPKIRFVLTLPLVVLLLATLAGCATVSSLDRAIEQNTHQAIVQSEALHNAKAITDDQFRAANLELNKVAVAGREVTKLIQAGKASTANVHTFLAVVAQSGATLQSADYGTLINSVLAYVTQLEADAVKLLGKL